MLSSFDLLGIDERFTNDQLERRGKKVILLITEPMQVTVVGMGYVGLTTGLGLAEQLINVDIDAEKVKLLNQGRSPIHKEGIYLNVDWHIGLLGTEFFGLSSSGWGHAHDNSIAAPHSRRDRCTIQDLTPRRNLGVILLDGSVPCSLYFSQRESVRG
jgi:hypothetical protein